MSRQKQADEIETREHTDELIQSYALMTNKAIYLPPGFLIVEMESRYGETVTKDYVIRRYEAHQIYYKDGLWIKDL